jgi:hypothetical protein
VAPRQHGHGKRRNDGQVAGGDSDPLSQAKVVVVGIVVG